MHSAWNSGIGSSSSKKPAQKKPSTSKTGISDTSSNTKTKQFVKLRYGVGEEDLQNPTRVQGGVSSKSKNFGVSHSRPPSSGRSNQTPSSSATASAASKTKLGKSNTAVSSSTNKLTPKRSAVKPTSSSPSTKPSSSQIPITNKGECEVCKQSCRSHCAGCKRVYYCCKQHQQQDWQHHKLTCRPFSIPTQYTSSFHLRPPGVSSATSLTNTTGSGSGISHRFDSSSAELQYMISTSRINPGSLIFSEKPLLVMANVKSIPTKLRCCVCLKMVTSNSDKMGSCPKCSLPFCSDCVEDSNGNSRKFQSGQGHSSEECAFITEFIKRSPAFVPFKEGSGNYKEFMRDLAILRVFMFRTTCPWRWDSLIALKNNPRYIACCKHNFAEIETWASYGYPVSNYFFKAVCKDKAVEVMDIVKILAIFSLQSVHNPNLLVVYENCSWVAHACSPNAELFFQRDDSDQTLEIRVKAVNVIKEGSKIAMNYVTDFDGGRSTLAIKLFQSNGCRCCDFNCICHQNGPDQTLGIRCDLVPSSNSGESNACVGILSPGVNAPNSDKPNLGLGVFMKSKKWECNRCKKSEKYGSIQRKITEIADELTQISDACCIQTRGQTYLHLNTKLLSSLSEHHWMVWKAKIRLLQTWNEMLGYGNDMLKSAVSLQPGSPRRENLIHTLKQKIDIYGEGIYSIEDNTGKLNVKPKLGVLDFIGERHGKTSLYRGELLFDAFYANLILLIEDYKKELPISPTANYRTLQVAKKTCKRLNIIRKILEDTVSCLKLSECGWTCGTGNNIEHGVQRDHSKLLSTASQLLETLNPVCAKVHIAPASVLDYMNDLVVPYSCLDTKFIGDSIKPSHHKPTWKNGARLEFEIDKINCGPVSYTFGTSIDSPSAPRRESKPSFKKTDPFSYNSFKSSFSTGNANKSFLESSDDENDANPFKYSHSNKFDSAGSSKKAKKPDVKTKEEDWSSFFSISSDDDDGNSEFDFGFPTNLGDDIYDDEALEDLAEWAALQFMMGKMKI